MPLVRDRPALRRLRRALLALFAVLLGGTIGYAVLGSPVLDAVYRTVTVVTTVGFQQPRQPGTAEKAFTIVLVLVGVGTTLYALGALLEVIIEGQLAESVGRRRMERRIAAMSAHVIICGWGRVGRVVADQLAGRNIPFVVVDMDGERVAGIPYPTVVGDATDDAVLRAAGIDRAKALVTVMSNDAADVYVTLSGRSLNPELFIVGRARITDSEEKIRRAGADRVVNPQAIGGSRIAAMLLQPHVAEFLDVVTRESGMEFRLEEAMISSGCPLEGRTLGDCHIRSRTGALVLALRQHDGSFVTNPPPETLLSAGQVLIAIGTEGQLGQLAGMMGPDAAPALS
ncbi:MAG TPA: NAD-binding protein [Acidimicrobiales bacterium]|nr:NAD-binding protein [Acidimicrobiales bacterium]